MQTGKLNVYGNVVQAANTIFQVTTGNTAGRPTATAGMLRFNTDTNRFEAVTGSTPAWNTVGLGDGSVSSITLASGSTGLSVANATVTNTGTITLNLAGELAGLNALNTTGLVARTAAGTYTPRAISASAVAGAQGLSVTNGDGVAAAPVVGLNVSGLTAASSVTGSNQVVIYDGTNNTRATITQVLANITGYAKTARSSFTSATLSSGVLTYAHNLGNQFNTVQIYDNNNKLVQPDDITSVNTANVAVDLTSFGTITGTWNIIVVG